MELLCPIDLATSSKGTAFDQKKVSSFIVIDTLPRSLQLVAVAHTVFKCAGDNYAMLQLCVMCSVGWHCTPIHPFILLGPHHSFVKGQGSKQPFGTHRLNVVVISMSTLAQRKQPTSNIGRTEQALAVSCLQIKFKQKHLHIVAVRRGGSAFTKQNNILNVAYF